MVRPVSSTSANPPITAPSEGCCTKIWRVVRDFFEMIWYFFEKIQLWRTPGLYQAKALPATIPNQGNTCFAAAHMQVVAANPILAGAYRTMLKSNGLYEMLFGKHYAVQVLDQYRQRQANEAVSVDIRNLRRAFGGGDNGRQEDAAELSQRIQAQMTMPSNGEVALEDGSKAAFGCRLQVWRPISQEWAPYEVSFSGRQIYSPPVFSLNFFGAFSLIEMFRQNYQLRFLDLPNTLVFNMSRQAFGDGGAVAVNRPVYSPLFLELPREMLAEGLKSPKYVLQGILSHDLGSAAGGHYVAYVHAAGRFYKMNDGLRTEVGLGEFLGAARTAYSVTYTRA